MNGYCRDWVLGLTAILACMTIASASSATILQTQTNSDNGHVYHLLAASSWTAAEAEAVSLGGHLATINDSDENEWVIDTFGGDDYALWIGLNDAAKEDAFVWASGEPFAYGYSRESPPWALYEPGGESPGYDYVNIHMGSHPHSPDLWNDWPNGGINPCHGVVEVAGSEPIPEPATMVSFLILGGLRLLIRRV